MSPSVPFEETREKLKIGENMHRFGKKVKKRFKKVYQIS